MLKNDTTFKHPTRWSSIWTCLVIGSSLPLFRTFFFKFSFLELFIFHMFWRVKWNLPIWLLPSSAFGVIMKFSTCLYLTDFQVWRLLFFLLSLFSGWPDLTWLQLFVFNTRCCLVFSCPCLPFLVMWSLSLLKSVLSSPEC